MLPNWEVKKEEGSNSMCKFFSYYLSAPDSLFYTFSVTLGLQLCFAKRKKSKKIGR